ncbi:MAG: acyl-CoA thioesterase [Gaiellaceae bacterium]
MAAVQGFGHTFAQDVAFRDVDGLGHVNNAVYLSYVESARLAYLQEVLGPLELVELGIVADVKISFRSPAGLGERLEVGHRVSRVGETSLSFDFEVRGGDGRLVAEGTTVHVAFDYGVRRPVPVPDEWRRRIESYEARSPVS